MLGSDHSLALIVTADARLPFEDSLDSSLPVLSLVSRVLALVSSSEHSADGSLLHRNPPGRRMIGFAGIDLSLHCGRASGCPGSLRVPSSLCWLPGDGVASRLGRLLCGIMSD